MGKRNGERQEQRGETDLWGEVQRKERERHWGWGAEREAERQMREK